MSSPSPERRDGKLESFLHKALTSDDYDRLLAKQPVVARTGIAAETPGKPVHRHAVLGHRRLYLTEVPPKSLKMTLDLRNVESIQMLKNPAEFLQGKERDEAVHVQLVFTKITKSEKGVLSTLSPALSRRRSSSSSSSTTTTTTRTSDKVPSSPKPDRLSLPLPAHVTHGSVKKSSSYHSLTHLDKQKITSSSSPGPRPRMNFSIRETSTPSPLSVHGASFLGPASNRKVEPAKLFQTTSVSPEDRKKWLMERSLKPTLQSLPAGNQSPQLRLRLSLSPDDSLSSSHSSPNLLLPNSSSSLSLSSTRRSPESCSTSKTDLSSRNSYSSLDLSSKHRANGQGEAKEEKCILDIYLLSSSNDFYNHLTTAWLDQIIAVTMAPEVPTYSLSTAASRPSDHFSHHFGSLKQEFQQSKTTKQSALLLQELCSACQKYFIIKRLFWENPDLLDHLIHDIQCRAISEQQLLTSEKRLLPSDLEYLLVVLELVSEMMRETHGLQRRCATLTEDCGRRLHMLVTSLVHLTAALPNLVSVSDNNSELVEKICSILSEIMKLVQQMRWPSAVKVGVVSLEWTLDLFSCHSKIRDFCGVIVGYESLLLQQQSIQPRQCVSLYYTAHLLHCLATHSRQLLHLLCQYFSEEFRYLLSVRKAKEKLPVGSALSTQTLTLLKHTKSRVLQQSQ